MQENKTRKKLWEKEQIERSQCTSACGLLSKTTDKAKKSTEKKEKLQWQFYFTLAEVTPDIKTDRLQTAASVCLA